MPGSANDTIEQGQIPVAAGAPYALVVVLIAKAGDFSVETGEFTARMGHFAVETGHFAAELGAFAVETGDFTVEMGAFAVETGHFGLEMGAFAVETGDSGAEMGGFALETGAFTVEMWGAFAVKTRGRPGLWTWELSRRRQELSRLQMGGFAVKTGGFAVKTGSLRFGGGKASRSYRRTHLRDGLQRARYARSRIRPDGCFPRYS